MRQGLNILPELGQLIYYSDVLSETECQSLYEEIYFETAWKQEAVNIFGRRIMQPRLSAWCASKGLDYTYSGLTVKGEGWTKAVDEARRKVEIFLGREFNSVLLNLYRHGKDSMGWHRDNEKELGPNPIIASLSLGQARKFSLRRYGSKDKRLDLLLEPGSILWMGGAIQEHWEHCLPKSLRIKEARINLTFRNIVGTNY